MGASNLDVAPVELCQRGPLNRIVDEGRVQQRPVEGRRRVASQPLDDRALTQKAWCGTYKFGQGERVCHGIALSWSGAWPVSTLLPARTDSRIGEPAAVREREP
jgi:hypothetical protein